MALLALLACRLAWSALLVPAFQHPDEPQHLAYIATLVARRSSATPSQIDPGVSRRVVELMAAHGWWTYYGRPTPVPLPARVEDAGLTMPLVMPRAYHVTSARLLRWAGLDDVMAAYWTLRAVSALLGLLTAAAIWAGCRIAFGRHVASGALALVALHPQFALVSTAVNPDVLVNLSGAVLWWQAAHAVSGPARVTGVALAVVAATVGALSKRVGLPLLGMAALVAVAAVLGARRGDRPSRMAHSWRLAMVATALAAVLGGLLLAEWTQVFRYAADLFGGDDLFSIASTASFSTFTRNLVQSAWLNAGWLTVPAPATWYQVAFAVSTLALGALPVLFVSATPGPKPWRSEDHDAEALDRSARWLLALAAAFVAIQAVSVYAGYYRAGYAAQGRYLFPVIGPFFLLVWIGATHWVPAGWRPLARASLLAVMIALDFWAWTRVIVPGFSR